MPFRPPGPRPCRAPLAPGRWPGGRGPASSNRPRGAGDSGRCSRAGCTCARCAASASRLPGLVPRFQVPRFQENSQGHSQLPGSIPLLNKVANSPEARSPCELLCFAFAVSAKKSLMRDIWESCLRGSEGLYIFPEQAHKSGSKGLPCCRGVG